MLCSFEPKTVGSGLKQDLHQRQSEAAQYSLHNNNPLHFLKTSAKCKSSQVFQIFPFQSRYLHSFSFMFATVCFKSCFLPTAKQHLVAPSFIDRIENVSVMEGEPIVLKCKVNGSPMPQVNWQKDGHHITRGSKNYR